jgi:nitrogen fixation protein NifU and related proteins
MLSQKSDEQQRDAIDTEKMLAGSGYSIKAIRYFIDKPYIGDIPNADQVSEMTGTCGDTMRIWLKVKDGVILDARYQVLGCPGAIASAMAVVDLVKGKKIADARALNDGDVFRLLEDIPAQKNHCIELAVKTFQKALHEYAQQAER